MTTVAPLPEARGRRIRALRERKMREKYGQFLAEGITLVEEAVKSTFTIEFVCGESSQLPFLQQIAAAASFPVYVVSQEVFRGLSTTETPQGAVAVVSIPKETVGIDALCAQGWKTCIALDHVSDPGNVGTVIRSADWFGAGAVVLSEGSVDAFNPKAVRGSMGSIFHIPVIHADQLSTWLSDAREYGAEIIGTAVNGVPFTRPAGDAPRMIVIGSEAHGLSPYVTSVCTEIVAIPRFGQAESLNAGITAAVMLAALRGVGA